MATAVKKKVAAKKKVTPKKKKVVATQRKPQSKRFIAKKTVKKKSTPSAIATVAKQFEKWRANKKSHVESVPDALLLKAYALRQHHTDKEIRQTLHIDWGQLKRASVIAARQVSGFGKQLLEIGFEPTPSLKNKNRLPTITLTLPDNTRLALTEPTLEQITVVMNRLVTEAYVQAKKKK